MVNQEFPPHSVGVIPHTPFSMSRVTAASLTVRKRAHTNAKSCATDCKMECTILLEEQKVKHGSFPDGLGTANGLGTTKTVSGAFLQADIPEDETVHVRLTGIAVETLLEIDQD